MESASMSQAEWQVMRVLWAYPRIRSQEVVERLEADFAWKPATVKTLLNRLKKKELIAMEKLEGKFYYQALLSEDQHLERAWKDLFANICQTRHGEFFLSILEYSQLSRMDLERISLLAKTKQEEAPFEVLCTCAKGQCRCQHICQSKEA